MVGSGRASKQRLEFRWANTILGNIKTALRSTYHAVRPKCAQRYLSEFEYRFNRRFDLPDIIPRLAYVALGTPPMPGRLLSLSSNPTSDCKHTKKLSENVRGFCRNKTNIL